jgi:hypothetical protein
MVVREERTHVVATGFERLDDHGDMRSHRRELRRHALRVASPAVRFAAEQERVAQPGRRSSRHPSLWPRRLAGGRLLQASDPTRRIFAKLRYEVKV